MDIKNSLVPTKQNRINRFFENRLKQKIYKNMMIDINQDKEKFAQRFARTFHQLYKKGKVHLFEEVLRENGLIEEYLKCAITDKVFMRSYNKKDCNQEKKCMDNLTYKLGIQSIENTYGIGLANRCRKLVSKNIMNADDISEIFLINKSKDLDTQSKIMENVLSLYDNNMEVGLHRCGNMQNAKQKIEKEGLLLTGHLSSGVARHSELR